MRRLSVVACHLECHPGSSTSQFWDEHGSLQTCSMQWVREEPFTVPSSTGDIVCTRDGSELLPRQLDRYRRLTMVCRRADGDAVWRRNPLNFWFEALQLKANRDRDGQTGKLRFRRSSDCTYEGRSPRATFSNLTRASFVANRKDKPSGVMSARVLFDGTNGIPVKTRTRIRDQE